MESRTVINDYLRTTVPTFAHRCSISLRVNTTTKTISEELIGIREWDGREQSCVAFSIDEQ